MERWNRKTLSLTWAELNSDVGEDRLACILSAFFASVLFILIYARLRLYPFGDNTLIYADGDQYASFYRMLADAVQSGEGLFYTFRAVLGNGLLPTAAYYAMSPFNLLMLFFPDNLIAGIHFTAYCKHVTTALTFCILLNARYRDRIPEKAVFSACYACIGYLSFFAWNLSWMDGVLILPLVCLGVLKLITEKKIALYVFSITYAIVSNYYIGFMICIASVLLYMVALTLFQTEGTCKTQGKGHLSGMIFLSKQSFPLYAFSSLTGAGLSAMILIPALAGIPDGRRLRFSDILEKMGQLLRPTDYFSMFFTGRMDDWYTNRPVLFFGIIPLLLVVLVFFDQNLSRAKKITAATLIFLFSFSFWNSAANLLWHGMSYNNAFNYRYSFLFSFFLLLLSFDMLNRMARARIPFMRASVFLGCFCLWVWNDTQGAFFAEDITRDIVLILAGLLLLRHLMRGTDRLRAVRTALLLLMCANVYRNAVTVMWPDVRTSVPATTFLHEISDTEHALAKIDDTSFFRLEKDYRTGRSDAPLFGYYGVSNYASTENVPLLIRLREYGIGHRWMWGFHTESTPLSTDALLGMKYILSKNVIPQKGFTEYASSDGIRVYENKGALPLVMFSETLPAFGTDENAFERMNRVFRAFDMRQTGDVFRPVETVATQEDELYYQSFTVGDEAGMPLYLYLDQPVQAAWVYTQDNRRELYWNEQRFLYYIGTFTRGTTVQVCLYIPDTLREQLRDAALRETAGTQVTGTREQWLDVPVETDSLTVSGTSPAGNASPTAPWTKPANGIVNGGSTLAVSPDFDISACLIWAEDTEAVAAVAASVQEKTTDVQVKGRADASVLNGAHVRAVIEADSEGYAVTTIPYDESWRVMLDGVRVKPERYMDLFLAVPVGAGEHTIELYYLPRGLVTGVLLTVLSIIALILRMHLLKVFRGQKQPDDTIQPADSMV